MDTMHFHPGHGMQPNLDSLAQNLKKTLQCASLTATEHATAQEGANQLERACVNASTSSKLRLAIFGSLACGLGTHGSDLDVTIISNGGSLGMQTGQAAATELQRIKPVLVQNSRFSLVEDISTARIPILKLRYEGKFDIDLSFNNTDAVQNTRLLQSYMHLDRAVRDLTMVVKLWAKGEGVCGAHGGNLSSYSFAQMVIYFMQVHPMVGMPCLPTWAFDNQGAVMRRALALWNCPVPLQTLVYRFFQFYAHDFHWGAEVVSVRLGQRAGAQEPSFERLSGRCAVRLHIEDPFLLDRNLNVALRYEQEWVLKSKFVSTFGILHLGATPPSLTREVPTEAAKKPLNEEKESTDVVSSGCESTASGVTQSRLGSWSGESDRDHGRLSSQPHSLADALQVGPASRDLPIPRFCHRWSF
mmetsp:Transcript_54409/g.117759  ORF Transcript_54409/g.117759 Transcript_54409/m.117759 type:complete len:415 (-) Transcript_54409:266-1510(-)|eukprot:CAMPEP_0170611528 /NCGR_PEP_ID=MMETSP0224-20130122/23235_1 /TAXON_ID=285029 /ORGANISM="Togula jolla, Strain CCCM 725" /LENGTH=414 /DNA_ID=CAMNT_0010936965 /DNA_START=103 /DNA_END=1347 /DNA_ORIENTATION=-